MRKNGKKRVILLTAAMIMAAFLIDHGLPVTRADTDNCTELGFGVSPPYLEFDSLSRGSKTERTVKLQYSCAYDDYVSEAYIEPGEIASWITVDPDAPVRLQPGEFERYFKLTIGVPANASAGDWRGSILFSLAPSDALLPDETADPESGKTGAGISTIIGVRALIDLTVIESEQTSSEESAPPVAIEESPYHHLRGRIIVKTEDAGRAYYVNPSDFALYYLGRPEDAFVIMRELGVGITNGELAKIPVGLSDFTGPDSDSDGLSDEFEDAIHTDKNSFDTNNDGCSDVEELMNECPYAEGTINAEVDDEFTVSNAGRIFIATESRGEAWYVNPEDYRRYFLGRPLDAYNIMRNLGLGISDNDFNNLLRY